MCYNNIHVTRTVCVPKVFVAAIARITILILFFLVLLWFGCCVMYTRTQYAPGVLSSREKKDVARRNILCACARIQFPLKT